MKHRLDGLNALLADMIRWRRYLHERPELSFQEEATSRYIAGLLREFGIETRTGFAGHAVIGFIAGGSPGPTVALRADIDALPIQDGKTCPYASKVPGVMHACGHDGHTATLLGLARWFAANRERLAGNVLLVFQHAEELCPGGAAEIIASGALDGADVIYGAHLWTPFPVGRAYTCPGPLMAAPDEFTVTIRGKGGHGGMPHAAVDAALIGAQTAVNLQTVVSRSVDPSSPAVVSVCSIQAGSGAYNVIAETCELIGTVRTFDTKTRALIRKRMDEIVRHTAAAGGAKAELKYREGYPALVNDEQEAERFFRVAGRALGPGRAARCAPIMAGEDFAYYLERIPGCFVLVGAGNRRKGFVYPHHHPLFDFDENAMLCAARVLAAMVLDYMDEHAKR